MKKLTASQLEEITGHPQWIDVCAVRGMAINNNN